MLIIVILNILLIFFTKKLLSNFNKINQNKLKKIFFWGLIVEIIIFIVYRLELSFLDRVVYYSDAETYWNNTLEILNNGTSAGYNSLYYYMCALLQLTSPFLWVGWNNIFNITCINIIILLASNIILKELKNSEKSEKEIYIKIKYLIIFIMYNPFIVYGLLRNLKDSLFLLMTFIIIYLYDYYYVTNSKKIKGTIFIIFIIFMYLFTMIRPWGFIIPVLAFFLIFITFIYKNKNNLIKQSKNFFLNFKQYFYKNWYIILLIFIIFVILMYYIIPVIYINVKLWTPIVFNSLFERNIVSTILGFGKFIFAPGPIRCLFGEKFFIHYMVSGNIMCFIGSIMWYLSIIILLICFKSQYKNVKKILTNKFVLCLFIVTIIFLFIYVIHYGGSAEIRLHAIFYIFIYVLSVIIFDIEKIQFKDKNNILLIFLMILLYIILSIISLVG